MGRVADIRQPKTAAASGREVAACGLWRFSLTFYRQPDVADALIALQDEAGYDVNLILYALWLGLSGRGQWDGCQIDAAKRAVRRLSTDVIAPLRALRRRLKPVVDADVQHLREKIRALEIEAEKAALDRLARLAGAPAAADPDKRLADAEANFARYLGAAVAGAAFILIADRLRRFAKTAGRRVG